MFTWPSIESLHNVKKYLDYLGESPIVRYTSKVKLHGTNCAVNVIKENGVVRLEVQSRTRVITPEDDLYGFAAWVEQHRDFWLSLGQLRRVDFQHTYFMEWCGPGVQSGVAVSQAPRRFAALFAEVSDGKIFIVDEKYLRRIFQNKPEDLYIIPEYKTYTIDFADLENSVAELNRDILAIEAECPFAKEFFDIKGIGEGLVLYPSGAFSDEKAPLMFKAKGEKHRTVVQKQPVVLTPVNAGSIEELVSLICPEARLQQGAGLVGLDKKLTGKFITWICDDVKKECAAEITASELTFDQIKNQLSVHARTWYLKNV